MIDYWWRELDLKCLSEGVERDSFLPPCLESRPEGRIVNDCGRRLNAKGRRRNKDEKGRWKMEGGRRGSTRERERAVTNKRGGQEEEGREVEVMDRHGCDRMCAWVRTCCLVLFLLLARARDNVVDSKNETSTALKNNLRNYVRNWKSSRQGKGDTEKSGQWRAVRNCKIK